MSKELVISSNRHETKVAILEDDQLVEVYFQRANEYSLAGSIHKGRVTRVLPGMQSAFVDLGLERDTFLYVSDFFEENEEYDRIGAADEKPAKGAPRVEVAKSGGSNAPPPKVAEAAAGESSGAGAAHALERSDEDPRRGRRSRRRRSRGRGFPESKYVSGPSTSEPVERSLVEEPEPEIEPAEDREVFLLPGESLAKYGSSGSQGGPEKISEARPVAQEAEEEIFRLQDDGDVAEPLPEGLDNEPEQLPEQVRAAKEPEAQSEEQTQPQPGDDKALVSSMSAAEETVEELIDAAPEEESSNEEAIEQAGLPVTDTAAPMLGDSGVSTFEDDVAFIEAMAGTEEDDEAMESTPSEPESTQPVTAAVREQGSRYLHRSSRRMRRRGRGGEGRTAAAAEAGIPAASAGIQAEIQRPVVRPEKSPLPSITDLLREGQEIIVQIAKEPLGQKGARITSHIALPGRYVVYMPTLEHLGVSRKIASDEERARLKKILQAHRTGISGGYIVRTAGEGKSEEDIAADMAFLYNLWLDIRQKAEQKPAPILLHHDLEIVQRILRDQLTDTFKAVWVDSEEIYESILRFMQRFQPALVSRVKMYTRPTPVFEAFNVTSELEKAIRPKVWLKSGGYIVINQTEALVAIDVNTGKYVGKSNRLEDTITKTNTEAVREIVRQVRLRDLGGIIVVDFIDMDERKNRQKVMQALEEAMRADRAPYKILQFNDFGLVAITRKRVKQSLERTLCSPCPACEGAGYVKSVQTVASEILQEANKLRSSIDGKNVVLRTNPDVAKFLKSNTNRYLEELEEILGKPVLVTSDPSLTQEKYDLG